MPEPGDAARPAAAPAPWAAPTSDLAVVVPTRDRAVLLTRLLEALEAQDLDPSGFEVVVVDDGSVDGTPAVLAAARRRGRLRLRSLRHDVPTGPAAARNHGWRASGAEVVAFTDDDCVPEPGWLLALAAPLLAWRELGVVQGRTVPPEGADTSGEWSVWRRVEGPSPWFEGCNVAYRRTALEQTGGFDEALAWYGEDTSLGWAVLDGGWGRAFADDAVVVHDVEERGWRWHVATAALEGNLVHIATRSPGFRAAAFARPWALHPHAPLTALALAGVLASIASARPWPLLATVPWLRARRPSLRRPSGVPLLARRFAVDAVSTTSLLRASWDERTLVV